MSDKSQLYVDYTFEFGDYNDMNEVLDSNNFRYKLNALVNLIHMAPGTVQDCPFMGIDMSGLQFSETDAVEESISKIQNAIMLQSSRYIEDGFVTDVEIETTDESGTIGIKNVSMKILLNGKIGVLLESTSTPSGLVFKQMKIDKSSFIS